MDFLSRNEVFEENAASLPKTCDSGAFLHAVRPALKIVGDVLAMIAIAVFAWFVWHQVLPYLWPAGPALVIAPGFWIFMGTSVIARVVWNILLLCPKVR